MASPLTSKLHLNGVFRLQSADGNDIRIGSRKSQAILALLATSPSGTRERRWIEGVLWSDKDQEKASANLRQALSALKRVLGPAGVSIESNRQNIRLDLSGVNVIADDKGRFLEDVAVKDLSFVSWVNRERFLRSPDAPVSGATLIPAQVSPWRVNIEIEKQDGPRSWFSTIFADMIARSLRETQSTPVSVQDKSGNSDRLVTIVIDAVPVDNSLGVRISMERRSTGRQIWSGQRVLPMQGGPPLEHPISLSLVNEIVGAVDQYLYSNSSDHGRDEPDRLYRQAVRDIFSMQPDRINLADELLETAFNLSGRGLILALRAQLKTIQRVEQLNTDTQSLTEEAEAYCAQALELEPDNSMVLALLANTAGHLMRDKERSFQFASRSVALNSANPMAWWALSSASMYLGREKQALQQALNGQQLSSLSQYKFWWDQQSFGALFAIGRHKEALQFLKATHAQNPNYRPPMRYLVALNAHFGDLDAAAKFATKLAKAEPGFSVRRLLDDKEYPASLIHHSPNLKTDELRDLIE